MLSNIKWCCCLLGLFFYSCSKKGIEMPMPVADEKGEQYFENEKDLLTWYQNDANHIQKHVFGNFEFSMQRLSADVLALQELKGNITSEAVFNEARSHYTDLLYFRLNIKNDQFHQELLKYEVKDAAEYNQRIQYCAFEINRDIFIQNRQDTLPCALHEYERTFNLESGLNFLLAFPKNTLDQDITVVYNDRLFKQGTIKFYFKKTDLPYLKIKSHNG